MQRANQREAARSVALRQILHCLPGGRGTGLKELLAALLHLILPTSCRVCHRPLDAAHRSLICGRCWLEILPVPDPFCPCCGRPFVSSIALKESPSHLCGPCRDQLPPFAMARAAALYQADGTMREAILLLKYGGRRTLASHLGRLMVEATQRLFDPTQFDLLIPVPLHPRRERARGFNQAMLLATEFGNGWGLAVGHRILHRVRATEAQSGGRREREDNVKDAFAVTRPDRVKDKKLLLIDDVFTTGATTGECARTLLAAGAAEVWVYTLARVE